MKTVLFLSISIDGFIANQHGIPMFPDGAWQDWCSLVNETGNVISGRNSFEQLQDDEIASEMHPEHKVVLSTGDIDLTNSSGERAWPSPLNNVAKHFHWLRVYI